MTLRSVQRSQRRSSTGAQPAQRTPSHNEKRSGTPDAARAGVRYKRRKTLSDARATRGRSAEEADDSERPARRASLRVAGGGKDGAKKAKRKEREEKPVSLVLPPIPSSAGPLFQVRAGLTGRASLRLSLSPLFPTPHRRTNHLVSVFPSDADVAPDFRARQLAMAVEAGVTSEVVWALNALQLISFSLKDTWQQGAGPLSKAPQLLSALVSVVLVLHASSPLCTPPSRSSCLPTSVLVPSLRSLTCAALRHPILHPTPATSHLPPPTFLLRRPLSRFTATRLATPFETPQVASWRACSLEITDAATWRAMRGGPEGGGPADSEPPGRGGGGSRSSGSGRLSRVLHDPLGERIRTYFPHSAGPPLPARPISALHPPSADDPLASAAAGAGGMSAYGRGHRGGGVESRGGEAGGEAGGGRGEDGGVVAGVGVGGKAEGDEVGDGGCGEAGLSAEEREVWWAERALFNHSSSASSTGGGRGGGSSAGERVQCAVAASSVLRNLSFLPHCASAMATLPACVAMLVGALEDFQREDEEVVSNAVDTFANIAAAIDLSSYPAHQPPLPSSATPLSSALPATFSSAAPALPASLTRSAAAHPGGDTGPHGMAVGASGSGADGGADAAAGGEGCRGVMSVERVLGALAVLLQGPVVAWQAAAAEAWGRLLLCRDNDLLLLPAAGPLQAWAHLLLCRDNDLLLLPAAGSLQVCWGLWGVLWGMGCGGGYGVCGGVWGVWWCGDGVCGGGMGCVVVGVWGVWWCGDGVCGAGMGCVVEGWGILPFTPFPPPPPPFLPPHPPSFLPTPLSPPPPPFPSPHLPSSPPHPPFSSHSLLPRLLALVTAPHPLQRVVRRAAAMLLCLAREPRTHAAFQPLLSSLTRAAFASAPPAPHAAAGAAGAGPAAGAAVGDAAAASGGGKEKGGGEAEVSAALAEVVWRVSCEPGADDWRLPQGENVWGARECDM
ncbi:unnamed protein product [Closterium sp. NIES-65]|nr:unnamed protein product [Closterium sp. NIES-65]